MKVILLRKKTCTSENQKINPFSFSINHHVRCQILQDSGCWVPPIARTPSGYTEMFHKGKKYYSHRLAYNSCKGLIPRFMDIHHICRNRSCVNPGHLELVPSSRHPEVTFGGRVYTNSELLALSWPSLLLDEFGLGDAEEYRDIPNLIGYRAGIDGTLWSCWSLGKKSILTYYWRPIKRHLVNGRYKVMLKTGVRKRNYQVHRLILETFVGPCPEGHEACHNNSDSADNRLVNLRWGTRTSNTADLVANGLLRRRNRERGKLSMDIAREIRSKDLYKQSIDDIARIYGVNSQTISDILAGKLWRDESENLDLRIPRGFHRRGEKNGSAKLTDKQREEITSEFSERAKAGSVLSTKKELALQYNVSLVTIYNILRESQSNKNFNLPLLSETQKQAIRESEKDQPRRGAQARKLALAIRYGVSLVLIYRTLKESPKTEF